MADDPQDADPEHAAIPAAGMRAMLERCPDMVTLIDERGSIRYVNDACRQLLGCAPGDLLGNGMRRLLDPAEDEVRATRLRGVTASRGAAFQFRYRCRHADGTWRTLEARSYNGLSDPDLRGVVSFSRDVTNADEAAQARGELRFRVVAESMRDGLLTIDPAGNVLYINAGVSRIMGYAPEERVGGHMIDVMHPDDLDNARRRFAAAMDNGSAQFDARIRRKDGAWRVVEGRADRLPPGNDAAALLITYRDVTEERAMRERLERNERRFRALTERSASSVMIVGEDKIIRYASPHMSLLDLSEDERVGRPLAGRVHPDDVARAHALFDAVVKEPGGTRRGDFRVRHADGTWRWHDITLANLLDDDAVAGVVVNPRDVTERIAAEEHMRTARSLEAIGRLAAGVAHDFNNLLTGILGNASLLAGAVTDPRQREDVEQIRVAGEKAAELTRQILAFSRRQVLKREHVPVNDLLRGLVRLLRRVTRANVKIELVTADEVGTVYADRSQLEQVVVNLAVNASDAMPAGGTLTIETSLVDADDVAAREEGRQQSAVGDGRAEKLVCIRVSDTGMGMSPEVVAHVFEPFFTTKELGRGTGLGLATVHGVVHQHDGRILVKSAPGEGSAFEVLLPASGGVAAPVRRERPRGPVARGCELLLVADDDEVSRRITVRLLEDAGYRVLVASSGEQALELFVAHADDIELVILDVVMPDLGGPATLTRMQELKPDVPYLFASGYAFEPSEADARIARHSLPKPFDLDELLRRVRAALDA